MILDRSSWRAPKGGLQIVELLCIFRTPSSFHFDLYKEAVSWAYDRWAHLGVKETCRGSFRLSGPRWSSLFPLSSMKSTPLIGGADKQVELLPLSLASNRVELSQGENKPNG